MHVILAAAGSFDPQGPAAASMADLWWLMLWLGAAVFVVFLVLLAVGLLRRGRAHEDEDGGPPPDQDPVLTRRWLVAGGVVMPTAVLLVVFGATLRSMQAVPMEAPADALVVEVVGHQWWWEVTYPDTGVTVRNELHLPVGRPVALQMTSADVIHSLWVPALGGKMDLLPDGTNTLVLEADEPGVHHTQCAEFCGLHHTQMKLLVVAEPPDAFAAWLEDPQTADGSAPPAPEVVTPTEGASDGGH
jgi:cytochrome c oxidase subunit 2